MQLRSTDEAWADRPASIQGPYMLVAKRMELNRSVDFGKPNDASNLYTLVMLAYAEPKVRPMFWAVRGIDLCLTDTGHELQQPQDDSPDTADLNSDGESRFQFAATADGAKKLARLRLTARFVLSEKSAPIDIPNLSHARSETRTLNGWRVTFKGLTRNDERYSTGVTVYRDNHTPDEWTEQTELLHRAPPRLLDGAGKPLETGPVSLNEGPDEWTWIDDDAPAETRRLKWDFPLQTRHADVSFEFKNLPLP